CLALGLDGARGARDGRRCHPLCPCAAALREATPLRRRLRAGDARQASVRARPEPGPLLPGPAPGGLARRRSPRLCRRPAGPQKARAARGRDGAQLHVRTRGGRAVRSDLRGAEAFRGLACGPLQRGGRGCADSAGSVQVERRGAAGRDDGRGHRVVGPAAGARVSIGCDRPLGSSALKPAILARQARVPMSSSLEFKQESRALLRLASPIILSQIAQVLMGLVDTVMSGHAGATEQAVVGLGVALWIPVFIGLMSVVQAVSPIIAHHFGAGDRAAVARDAREGMWLALGAGLVPLILVPWAPDLLMWFRIEPALAARAGVFLWGIGLGLPAGLVYRSLAFYSASINKTRPIMVLAFLGLGINALLNWVLIYGHVGLPAMGGAG